MDTAAEADRTELKYSVLQQTVILLGKFESYVEEQVSIVWLVVGEYNIIFMKMKMLKENFFYCL